MIFYPLFGIYSEDVDELIFGGEEAVIYSER